MKTDSLKLNWPLVGNSHIFEFFKKSLANKSIGGGYIFSGPTNVGKTTVANYLAQSLICQSARSTLPCGECPACLQAKKGIHGDIYLIKKPADKKNISITQVRDFIRNLSMSSFLNSYKIGIIKGAEALSEGAVNALLKTLEEPKLNVIIILTANDFSVLPETIVSRSQVLKFKPVAGDTIYDDLIKNHGAKRSQAKNFSRLAAGRPALALKFLEDKAYFEDYKTKVKAFFEFLSPDLNRRLKVIEKVQGEKPAGQESIKSSEKIISIWKNLTRDLIFQELGLNDLRQHQAFDEELMSKKNKFNLKSLINLAAALKRAGDYLNANVNSRLALEDVAVNI